MSPLCATKGVLDMTFLDIYEEGDLSQALVAKFSPPISPHHTATSPDQTKTKRKLTEVIKALRLSNNEISSIDILYKTISTQVDTANILWYV